MLPSNKKEDEDGEGVTFINLSNGAVIPLIKSSSHSSKMKPRKVAMAAKKYLSIYQLSNLLEKGKKIVRIRNKENCPTVEEELLGMTHLVIVVENNAGGHSECLAPVDESGLYMQYTAHANRRISSSMFYRGVADHNGFVLVAFSYTVDTKETEVKFDVSYIDFYSLEVTKHESCVQLTTESKFKFNIMVSCGIFCILWPFHKRYSVLDFSAKPSGFVQFPVQEDLEGFYVAELTSNCLMLTINNTDFEDDVFFNSIGSKRHTLYYNLKTGLRHSSNDALEKMSTLMNIEHPLDVVFLNMPNKPMWMVTECLPEEMTLSAISFFSDVEVEPSDTISCVTKRIELNELFASYDELIQPPNQLQINFVVCKIHWHVFLWISKQHILEIDLDDLEPSGVLQMHSRHYDDYKNELNEFTLRLSLTRKDINVFVKDKMNIIHFETFYLPPPLSLQELAKYAVVRQYPKSAIEMALSDSILKTQLLAAY